jgi:hypothetical protein
MDIPESFCQINFHFGGTNLPFGAECTLAADMTGFIGTPTELATEVKVLFEASTIQEQQDNDVILQQVSVKFGPTATGASGAVSASSAGGGGSAGRTANTAYLIHKQTAFGGHAGKGRLYLPGVVSSVVSDAGTLNGTFPDVMSAAWNNFRDDLDEANIVPVVLHGDGSPLTIPSPITSFLCDPRVGTQRRRMRR